MRLSRVLIAAIGAAACVLPFPPAVAGTVGDDSPIVYFRNSLSDAPEGEQSDLYSISPDGSNRNNLTPGSENIRWATFALSPDKQSVSYVGTNPRVLRITSLDATEKRQIAYSREYPGIGWHAWSPDGTKLAYIETDEIPVSPGHYDYPSWIRVVWLDGLRNKRLTSRDGKVTELDWDASGKRLVYVEEDRIDDGDIWTVDLHGRQTRITGSRSRSDLQIDASPTDDRVLFTGDSGVSDADRNIFVTSLEGEKPRRLTYDGNATQAKWSPDGTRILFHRKHYFPWTMSDDGTDKELLMQGLSAQGLDWSPSGEQLVGTRFNYEPPEDPQSVTVHLFIINSDGTGYRRLGEPEHHRVFEWLPQW